MIPKRVDVLVHVYQALDPAVRAGLDDRMRRLLDERRDLRGQLRELVEVKGLGENHDGVVNLRIKLEELDEEIEQHAESFRRAKNLGQVGNQNRLDTLLSKQTTLTAQKAA